MNSALPKIRLLLPPGFPEEAPFPLEQARTYLNFKNGIFQVDGQRIGSYEELVHLASQEKYRNREYIDLVFISMVAGG